MLNLVKAIWSKIKDNKILWAILIGVALAGGGYVAGRNHKDPAIVVEKLVEDVATKQKLVEVNKTVATLQKQLIFAQQTITELRSNTKTVVHVVKTKDGTVTIDKTTETKVETKTETKTDVVANSSSTNTSTNTKTVETDTKTHKETEKTVTPIIKDKVYLGISAQVGITGIANPGLEFKYRVVDLKVFSAWAGTEAILPSSFKIQETQLRINVGVSF